MDCRAVVLILLLAVHAACAPTGDKDVALNLTIQMMQNETKIALGKLNGPGLFPTTTCQNLNIEQYVGQQQDNLTAQVSSFCCYLSKMSELAPDLTEELEKASQYALDVKKYLNATENSLNCSLPVFEETMKAHEFVKCFLDQLDQRLEQGL